MTPHISSLMNPYEEMEFLKSGWLNGGFFIAESKGKILIEFWIQLLKEFFH